MEGIADLGTRWDNAGIRWAATGAIAAVIMAPYLTFAGSVFEAKRPMKFQDLEPFATRQPALYAATRFNFKLG